MRRAIGYLPALYSERNSDAYAQFDNLTYLFSVSSESVVQIAWDTRIILKEVREEINKSFRELRELIERKLREEVREEMNKPFKGLQELIERKEKKNENIMKDLKKFLQEVKTEK